MAYHRQTSSDKKKRWGIYGNLYEYRNDSDDEGDSSLEWQNNLNTAQTFQEVIEKGKEQTNSFRVMVIGCCGQGKTSLVRKLQGKQLGEPPSTNGVEIHSCMGDGTGAQWLEKTEYAVDYEFAHRLVPIAETLDINKESRTTKTAINDQTVFDRRPPDQSNSSSPIPPPRQKHNPDGLQNRPFPPPRDRAFTCVTRSGRADERERAVQIRKQTKSDSFLRFNKESIYRKFAGALKGRMPCEPSLTDIKVWDFGGEFVFYATHQLFLCRQAVYLLVFRLDVALDDHIPDTEYPGRATPHQRTMKDYIEFWVSSVHAFVGHANGQKMLPTIILVGTHKDKLVNNERANEYFEEVRKMFDGRKMRFHLYNLCFAVSSVVENDPDIERLREAIMHIYEIQIKPQLVPAKWILLENALDNYKVNDVLPLKEVKKIAGEPGLLMSHGELEQFLRHHHDVGTLFYVSDKNATSSYVVLNPQFIVDAFKCVITSKQFLLSDPQLRDLWNRLSEKAVLDPAIFDIVWNEDRFRNRKDLLRNCLIKMRIIANALHFDASEKFTPLNTYIVPSMLRSHSKDEVRDFLENKPRTFVSLLYEFEDEAVLPIIYNKITASAIGTWPVLKFKGKDLLFINCSAYKLNATHSGLIKLESNHIEILVVQLCVGNVIASEWPDYFRRFVEFAIRCVVKSCDTISTKFRCMDEMHGDTGSIESYEIKIVDHNEMISCPDHVSHSGISTARVKQTWFADGMAHTNRRMPTRRLTDIERSKLTAAIGNNWQFLGLTLGLDSVLLSHINANNRTEELKIFDMLTRWDQKKCASATWSVLVKALNDTPQVKCNWNTINNIIDGFIDNRL